MNETTIWFLLVGVLLILMVLGEEFFKRAAISAAMVYLAIGFGLGPLGLGILRFSPTENSKTLEFVAEIVVLISLFSAGLKLRIPFQHAHWRLSLKLATLTMVSTVVLIAVLSHYVLHLPWAFALLLGGILAPTDPVLASAVQVEDERDDDRLRIGLTGEAGLNDGTAFPVVMLALTLLGLHWRENQMINWLLVDVLWATVGGLAIGYGVGWLGSKAIIWVHPKKDDELLIEDFISIGLIALSYALALMLKSYGFLAVFACGLAFARVEQGFFNLNSKKKADEFSPSLIKFTSQMERIGEVLTVVIVGAMLSFVKFDIWILFFALALILVIRPLSVLAGTLGSKMRFKQRTLISWFGIRGIGSIYYLSYAMNHGVKGSDAEVQVSIVLTTVALSILVHGITANPFMKIYNRSKSISATLA
ncbi:MAG: sodium:proton antiporter [Verrucomicrobiales bacterium]|nr:sodium:proton antiporter [Verrucomicrobiales bacterium]